MHVTRIFLLTSICISGLSVANTSAASDSSDERLVLRKHGDWWFGADAGAGSIQLELPEGKVSKNKFYLGVRAEYVLSPGFLLGIEASGWLIRPVKSNTTPTHRRIILRDR